MGLSLGKVSTDFFKGAFNLQWSLEFFIEYARFTGYFVAAYTAAIEFNFLYSRIRVTGSLGTTLQHT